MKYFITSAIVLILALQACKAPTSPNSTLSNPTLTIFAPDTARVFDTIMFRAHYSDSVKLSWKYVWQFGDFASASTKDSSITHVYDSVGTYTVRGSLVDTNQKTIAKDTTQIKILPLSVPTLTLMVPDTNFWGDSCVMVVSSSQLFKHGWKFIWSLGDSTTVSGTDSILHYYLNPGTYTVSVSLLDTVHRITLNSEMGTVHVVARHFNLAFLQSMKYVDINYNGFQVCSGDPMWFGEGSGLKPDPLNWNGFIFGQKTSSPITHDSSAGFYESTGSDLITNGSIDTSLTALNSISIHWGYYQNLTENYVNIDDYSQWSDDTAVYVPLIKTSDTDLVFGQIGPLTRKGAIHSALQGSVHLYGYQDWQCYIDFSNEAVSRYIIIRFHN